MYATDMLRILRRRPIRRAIILLLTLGVALASHLWEAPAKTHATPPTHGVVRFVVDGDTIELQSGERLRLLDIDAPEYEGPEADRVQAEAATGALRALLPRRTEITLTYGARERDVYDRLLAYCVIEGQTQQPVFVNLRLVALGLARPYRGSDRGPRYQEILQAAEKAKAEARGLWRP
jgi:micrococcal nuclease